MTHPSRLARLMALRAIAARAATRDLGAAAQTARAAERVAARTGELLADSGEREGVTTAPVLAAGAALRALLADASAAASERRVDAAAREQAAAATATAARAAERDLAERLLAERTAAAEAAAERLAADLPLRPRKPAP
jgi:hypothetical protein